MANGCNGVRFSSKWCPLVTSANQSKGAIHVNEMMMLMLVLGLVLVLLLMIMMCRNDKSRRIVFMFLPAFLFFLPVATL